MSIKQQVVSFLNAYSKTTTASTYFATNSYASFKMSERVIGQPVIMKGSFGQGVSFIVLRYVVLEMLLGRI